MDSDTSAELHVDLELVALIERRQAAFLVEIPPILRDDLGALASPAEGCVVDGFPILVLEAGGEAAVETPPYVELAGLFRGISVRGHVGVACQAFRTGLLDRAGGVCIGQKGLHGMSALDAEVSGREHHGGGKILLHRKLPVLRITWAEVGVEGEGVEGD